jgi:hypothetical protein
MAQVGRAAAAGAGWLVGGGSWSAGQPPPPSRPSTTHTTSVDRLEAPMSKLTRTLAVGVTLAAITLVGMTTLAHAQPTDEPSRHQARRPPTQGQVGEAWHQHPVTSQQQTAQERTADAVGRVLARERSTIPNATPAQVPTPTPTQPNQRPSWVLASFGVLAVLMLVVGLAVLAARRASRRARLGAASPTR